MGAAGAEASGREEALKMALVFKDQKGLVLVLEPENLARMKAGDPFTVPDLNLTVCYEELPQDKLVKALADNPRKYLERGWQNHPDDYRPAQAVPKPAGERKL